MLNSVLGDVGHGARSPGFQVSRFPSLQRGAVRRPAARFGPGSVGGAGGDLADWKPGTLGVRAGRREVGRRRPGCPECPRGAHSGGGHGLPHGPAARVPRGDREVRSERTSGASWECTDDNRDTVDVVAACHFCAHQVRAAPDAIASVLGHDAPGFVLDTLGSQHEHGSHRQKAGAWPGSCRGGRLA